MPPNQKPSANRDYAALASDGRITGAVTQLVTIPGRAAARRPINLEIVDAAGAVIGAKTADQALDTIELSAGHTIRILAAAGNVGSFAVQLAKQRGAG